MSLDALPEVSSRDREFAQVWAEATARVLESLHGKPFAATPRPPAAAETAVAASGESLWTRFRASGWLTGELAFQFTRSDGVRLAQFLAGEPLDGAAAFNEGHTDALDEVFRRFAEIAATACKRKYGGEVLLKLERGSEPRWKPAGYSAWIFTAPEIAPLQWTLMVDETLSQSIGSLRATRQQEAADESKKVGTVPPTVVTSTAQPREPAAVHQETPPPEPPDAIRASAANANEPVPMPANLDLLLDVELNASLRFGQREMLLREILELRPGSVVELDRKLQEPAELLVAGRVIARGEVVIVDGSYGLRITDIVQPRQRLESIET